MNLLDTRKMLGKRIEPDGELPEGKTVLKTTLKMAWPSMVEMLLVSLVGFVDTVMVSSCGESAIAAVGLTNQPKFLGLCFFFAVNIAVSAVVARRKGEENQQSATAVLRMALLIVLGLTVVITAVFVLFADQIIWLAGAQADTHGDATAYLRIIMGFQVFNVFSLVINAAQRGSGNTRISMKTNVVSNVVNLFFNYLLIGGNFGFPALGVRGAAIATVFGTVVACGMSIASLFHKDSFIRFEDIFRCKKKEIFNKQDFSSILNVSSSSLVEQVFLRIGFFIFAIVVAKLGTVAMAAHQIGMNLMSISFSVGDGLQVAAVALVGQSLGRKRPDMAKIYATVCQRIGLVFACVLSVVYVFFGRNIYMLFSNDAVVLDYGQQILRILCLVLFFQIPQVIFFGSLRGAGDTRFTAAISLVSVTLVRPALSWLLCYPLGFGLIGAWVGVFMDQFLRFALAGLRFRTGKWTKIKL